MHTKQRTLFGTFGGVFTPSLLTILGVIMFLRAGWVVGEAGIRGALIILAVGELITLITATSTAAIATNTPVRGGGAYFLISRSLGPQFGGAIGLALYLAQALSVPFYVIGFTEAAVQSFPALQPFFLPIALGTVFLLFVLNVLGASWAIKTQFVVLGVLALSIVAFLGGALSRFDGALMRANWTPSALPGTLGLWAVFAVYFPAVTGILAGINMSGDLRDPARSIVRGTFAAIAVGAAIYAAQIVICGGAFERADLLNRPYRSLVEHALFGARFLVIGGVFAATLSSAMGSMLTAPRVLQALARDRLLPGLTLFGRGAGPNAEPRRALSLTLLLSLLVVWAASGQDAAGAFNAVAEVITMFFLCTYGMINLAAFVESFGGNPSFRPRYRRFHWSLSLLGALACVAVMATLNAVAAVIAAAVVAALYLWIGRSVLRAAFGDARRGFLYALIRRHLLRLRNVPPDPKNWRPTLLVLLGEGEPRPVLLRYGAWLEAQRGILTAVQLVPGRIDRQLNLRKTTQSALESVLRDQGVQAFAEAAIAERMDEGLRMLAQTHSIGPIKPNTFLMAWPDPDVDPRAFAQRLRDLRALGKSVVCVSDRDAVDPSVPRKRIDCWWRGRRNGSLMLILAYLLTRNWAWARAEIRILRMANDETARAGSLEALRRLIAEARIEARAEVVVADGDFEHTLFHNSRSSDLTLLGMDPPEDEAAEAWAARYHALLDHLPAALLVASTGEADLTA